MPYPKGLRIGQPVKIETADGMREFVPTRWRGLVRAVDIDGAIYFVRRWAGTKAAAIAATERAGHDKLKELARARAQTEAPDATTVTELLARWRVMMHDESNKLHESTRDDYETSIRAMLGEPLRPLRGGTARERSADQLTVRDAFSVVGAERPADVSASDLKAMFRAIADSNGRGTAIKVRSILAHVWDLAMENDDLGVQVNTVRALRGTESNPVIPNRTKRESSLDHRRAPTDDEYRDLMSALSRDPEAGPMLPGSGRRKSKHGAAGTGLANGKDIRDLVMMLFGTGARQGELLAVRWNDISFTECVVSISATLSYTPGEGVKRTPTKTKSGAREVHLVAPVVAMLCDRAELFGIDVNRLPATPVFGSPQAPRQFRDPSNLNRSIRTIFNRHGLTWGRSHIGRKYVVNHLIRERVPLTEIARVVGWGDVLTVSKYADTARAVSADTRAALARSVVAG